MDPLTVVAIGAAAVIFIAKLVVNLTPTPADDEVFAQVYRWIEVVAGIVTKRAKDDPARDEAVAEALYYTELAEDAERKLRSVLKQLGWSDEQINEAVQSMEVDEDA